MYLKAIILVAGMGSRLKPLTNEKPKCLTEVNGIPILTNALTILANNNVKETVLVIGYLGDLLKEVIGDSFSNMKINYVENNIYNKTNTAYSLSKGLEAIGQYESIFILEGDVYFENDLFSRMCIIEDKNLTALEKYNPNLDGSFVELNKAGFVVDWVHKKNRRSDYVVETKFKTVNIHRFDEAFVKEKLKPALDEQIEKYEGNVPMEDVMRVIVTKDSSLVKGFEVSEYKWFEIDNINDLKIAEEIFK